MAQPAWLDDLSEDWPSQSETDVASRKPSVLTSSRYQSPRKQAQLGDHEESSVALSERSFSQINIPMGMRRPSKLVQTQSVRSVSAGSTGSVVHKDASPVKGDTPEWKRRLIHGQLDAGEQPDLFTGARTGLESIFQPPPPNNDPLPRNDEEFHLAHHHNDTTMPSSPPAFAVNRLEDEDDFESQEIQESPSVIRQRTQSTSAKKPREVRYMKADSEEPSKNSSFSIHKDQREVSGPADEPSSFSEIPLSALLRGATSSSATAMPPPPVPEAPQATEPSRQASNQSVVRNEDLSPIMMSPTKDKNGRIIFAPMTEVPATQLRSKLEKLRLNQLLLDSPVHVDGREGTENAESTEELMRLGAFINCQRGGRSAEGSFRHRLLSPCDTSDMLPEDSLQASTPKQFPSVRDGSTRSPAIPAAPYPSPEKGSRRSPLRDVASYGGFDIPCIKNSRLEISAELESALRSDPDAPQTPQSGHHGDVSANQFGSGKFDGYQFHEEVSYNSNPDESELGATDKENYSPEDKPARSRTTLKFDLSALSRYDFSVTSPAEHPGLVVHATPKKYDSGSEPKRPRSSPSKNPTPKRRRTLHESDVAYGQEQNLESRTSSYESVQHTHRRMQAVLGRKRKDARNGEPLQRADPQVLASRQILRPRNPTPRSSQRESQPLAELHINGDDSNIGDHSAISEQSASFAAPMRTPRAMARKPSIKTQDFLDEAEKIMAMIRNKARPAGLSSVEESELEGQSGQQEDSESFEDSSIEPLSRPPSREGRPLQRISTRQDDPELAQRLKRYEERSDMGDLITSSMRSLGLVKDAMAEAARVEREVNEVVENRSSRTAINAELEVVIASDPPNIRITSNPDLQMHGPDVHTNGSHGSSQASASSKGSESWKTIPPQNVSHLIPDQVGNMVLDRQHNMWVKRKGQKTPAPPSNPRNILPSEDSEDDPFASIPDLTVDMTLEMRNLRLSTAQKPDATEEERIQYAETPSPTQQRRARPASLKSSLKKPPIGRSPLHQDEARPPLLRNNETLLENDKEVEHEITIHEDRIKSSPPRRKNLTISFSSPIASIIRDAVRQESSGTDESVNSNNQWDASPDHGLPLNDVTNHSTRRAHFGSLSSNGGSLPQPKGTPVGSMRNASRRISLAGHHFIPRPVSRIEEREEESTAAARKKSMMSSVLTEEFSALIPNDESVVEEQEDESVNADESALVPAEKGASARANTSLSFMVTPAPNRTMSCPNPADAAPVISQCVGTLSLSPLSEFTINNGEQSMGLEVSYLVGGHRLVTGDGNKRVMSFTVKDLVNRIAEVVPFEPDWQDLRDLVLSKKSLASLHKLDQFCGGLVTLDASQNQLSQLDGVPPGIRNLKITDNRLTELTGWGHLMNLQYLDVSNNELKSLSALRGLVHLRDVKANHNLISSLEDLLFHDGIQTLRARGNLIEELDFEGTSMQHLVELDLEDNYIERIEHVEALTSLASLNLQGNKLKEFGTSRNTRQFQSLKYLKLSDNSVSTLDLSNFPALRLLHADRNDITTITGFNRAHRLDSLSLREQKSGELDVASILASAYEVRKLFISGNLLPSFNPQIDLLNLQYLEMANCGLESLPENLGQMCPNLRVLNANFNALDDLRGLRDVPRLKKLLVAGNRLEMEGEKVVGVLGDFPHLRELDVRDNPATLGFYAPVFGVSNGHSNGGGDDATTAMPMNMSLTKEKDAINGNAGGDGITESTTPGPFELPRGDKERDEKFASRLDRQTRMRRRLYEILLMGACQRLKCLDGLLAPRGVEGLRDAVWKGLVERGLLSNEGATTAMSGTTTTATQESMSSVVDGVNRTSQSTNTNSTKLQTKTKTRQEKVMATEHGTLYPIEEESKESLGSLASKRAAAMSGATVTVPEAEEDEDSIARSERWGAEDSFAG
ncbi:hypothetical protein MKZ38_002379 [Zalerion maritima]|uniref:Septation initiation network scaffold protein cdc11 n=1 Tax=Zalerion maritima TaxID=339359 RepID=A0AAD5RXA7_9PEZI|nr:hypothetical protein MKZ38_002379 [Zalerion maritima]